MMKFRFDLDLHGSAPRRKAGMHHNLMCNKSYKGPQNISNCTDFEHNPLLKTDLLKQEGIFFRAWTFLGEDSLQTDSHPISNYGLPLQDRAPFISVGGCVYHMSLLHWARWRVKQDRLILKFVVFCGRPWPSLCDLDRWQPPDVNTKPALSAVSIMMLLLLVSPATPQVCHSGNKQSSFKHQSARCVFHVGLMRIIGLSWLL